MSTNDRLPEVMGEVGRVIREDRIDHVETGSYIPLSPDELMLVNDDIDDFLHLPVTDGFDEARERFGFTHYGYSAEDEYTGIIKED